MLPMSKELAESILELFATRNNIVKTIVKMEMECNARRTGAADISNE